MAPCALGHRSDVAEVRHRFGILTTLGCTAVLRGWQGALNRRPRRAVACSPGAPSALTCTDTGGGGAVRTGW
jgi:hypothetical protein